MSAMTEEFVCPDCDAGPFRSKSGLGVHRNGLRCPGPAPQWSNVFNFDTDAVHIDVGFNMRFVLDAPDDTLKALWHLVDLLERDRRAGRVEVSQTHQTGDTK